MEEKDRLDSITRRIIGVAIEAHRRLRPALLEPAYGACLAFELRQMGLKVGEQRPLPVVYRGRGRREPKHVKTYLIFLAALGDLGGE